MICCVWPCLFTRQWDQHLDIFLSTMLVQPQNVVFNAAFLFFNHSCCTRCCCHCTALWYLWLHPPRCSQPNHFRHFNLIQLILFKYLSHTTIISANSIAQHCHSHLRNKVLRTSPQQQLTLQYGMSKVQIYQTQRRHPKKYTTSNPNTKIPTTIGTTPTTL